MEEVEFVVEMIPRGEYVSLASVEPPLLPQVDKISSTYHKRTSLERESGYGVSLEKRYSGLEEVIFSAAISSK